MDKVHPSKGLHCCGWHQPDGESAIVCWCTSRRVCYPLCPCASSLREHRLVVTQVGEVGPDWFCVYLIPETLRATTLGTRREGDSVNIEIDAQTQAIVDTVEKVVASHLAKQPQLAGAQ